MKKTIGILAVVTLFLCASLPATIAYASNQQAKDQVVVEILFSNANEAELFKTAMADTQQALANSYKELMLNTNDADKKDYVLSKAEEVQAIDLDALFSVDENGVYAYTVPYPNVEIAAGDQVLFADEDGMLSIPDSVKDGDATISLEGYAVEAGELNLEENPDGSNTIKVTRTLEELSEGMLAMGESMAVEGQGNVYRAKMNPGDIWAPGTSHGQSIIVYSTTAKKNIVGCNKLHTSYTASVSAAALATGGSDCGISIRLGMLPIGYSWSDYCLAESLGSDGGGKRFCTNNTSAYTTDGVYREGHYNCSWFPGVTCSEEGHTHN